MLLESGNNFNDVYYTLYKPLSYITIDYFTYIDIHFNKYWFR